MDLESFIDMMVAEEIKAKSAAATAMIPSSAADEYVAGVPIEMLVAQPPISKNSIQNIDARESASKNSEEADFVAFLDSLMMSEQPSLAMQALRYGPSPALDIQVPVSVARTQVANQEPPFEESDSEETFPIGKDQKSSSNKCSGGRKSNFLLKQSAFQIMPELSDLMEPCNKACHLDGKCTTRIRVCELVEARNEFWGHHDKAAPDDKSRAKKIWEILQQKTVEDKEGNLTIRLMDHQVCPAALLRILGLMKCPDLTKGPGQFLRLLKERMKGTNEAEALASEKVKLDKNEKFTQQRGFHKAYIHEYCEYYADTIPTVKSKYADVFTYSVPFKTVSDFYVDFLCACKASNAPCDLTGSSATFRRAFKEMAEDGLVQLLGGKGGFQTCSVCNNALAIKKSAASRRDLVTINIVKKLLRNHLIQQQNERQHAENWIQLSKTLFTPEGMPDRFYICIDGQTVEATKAPVMSNSRSNEHPTMENRNMGVRMVCGPIDEYMSICTGDLIPGGANVLIECVRIATETLASKLARLTQPLTLPKRAGYNFDNCGENKNKELFCWLSHLVELCFFDAVEVFFLVVGHTHNPVDRWFSVLASSIGTADFIGSILAMQELFRYATNKSSYSDSCDTTVVQLTTYRDYRTFYEPVVNLKIVYFNIPHRFLIERHPTWGIAFMRYQIFSPKAGWANKWLPLKPSAERDHPESEGALELTRFMIFGGEAAMLNTLGMQAHTSKFGEAITAASDSHQNAKVLVDQIESLKYLRELELLAIAEGKAQMEFESTNGIPIPISSIQHNQETLKAIEDAIISRNSAEGGYIIWLKRAQSSDPNWLNGTPNVLPNPRKWQRLCESAAPATAVTAVNVNRAQRLTADERKAKQEETKRVRERLDAVTSLANLHSGAAKMYKTSQFMLSQIDTEAQGRVDVSASNEILEATENFTKTALSSQEIRLYKSLDSVDNIIKLVEVQVAAAEAEPWSLLRLPEETEELKQRKLQIQRDFDIIQAKKESSLTRLLTKKGTFDTLAPIVSHDGFRAVLATNIDEMTKEQLKQIAKGLKIAVSIRGADNKSKEKSKEVLLQELKAALARPENRDVDPTVLAQGSAVAQPITTLQPQNIMSDRSHNKCSVLECPYVGSVACVTCSLSFCNDLHKYHDGHINLDLREGYRFPRTSISTYTSMASQSNEVIEPQLLEAQDHEEPSLESEEDIDSIEYDIEETTNPLMMDAITILGTNMPVVEPHPSNLIHLAKRQRTSASNDTSEPLEQIKLQVAVAKVKQILDSAGNGSSGDTRSRLRSALSFITYDVDFLIEVGSSLGLNMDPIAKQRRVTRDQTREFLISTVLLQ